MFSLTSQEEKALFFVAVALALSLILRWALPHRENPGLYDYSLRDSLFKALSADTLQTAGSGGMNPSQIQKQAIQPHVSHMGSQKKSYKRHSVQKVKNSLKPHSINVNTASAARLKKLPGIGPKTASAIVNYRNTHGPFTKLDQLKKVKRIGPKTLKKIEPYIVLGKKK